MKIAATLLLALLTAASLQAAKKKYSHYDMAMNLKAQNKIDEAVIELQNSISVDPDDPTVHNALAEIQYAKGSRDAAVLEWEKAIACGSTDPAYYQKGVKKRSVEWIRRGPVRSLCTPAQ